MTIQAGLTDSTWQWLSGLGWREEDFHRDRRRYRDVPPSLIAELFDARDADERAVAMDWAIAAAAFRPEARIDRH